MSTLTDMAIRRAKPSHNAYTFKDGAGLFLNIKSNGTKQWLYRFYWKGNQTRVSLGLYPKIDLKKARSLRQQMQDKLSQGLHPRDQEPQEIQKTQKEAKLNSPSFATFAIEQWFKFKLKKLGNKAAREKRTKADKAPKSKLSAT